jgi:hypothetical protein
LARTHTHDRRARRHSRIELQHGVRSTWAVFAHFNKVVRQVFVFALSCLDRGKERERILTDPPHILLTIPNVRALEK